MHTSMSVVISPEKLFRAGLRSVLLQAGHSVAGEWDHLESVKDFFSDQPVLVLLDESIGQHEIARHVARAHEMFRRGRIVVLGNSLGRENVVAVQHAGAAGFIAKDSSSQELLSLLDMVTDGHLCFPALPETEEEAAEEDLESRQVVKPDPRELCREMGLLAAINTCRKHRWTDLLRVIQAEREAALAVPEHWQ